MSDCDVVYEVRYKIRGQESSDLRRSIATVKWGRRYDEISTAEVVHVIGDPDCCADLSRLEPWADTVTIYEDGEAVWHGWVTGVDYSFDSVAVQASDALVWARYRVLSEDYSARRDSAQHFGKLWDNAMLPSPIPVTVNTYDTGVVEYREYSTEIRRRSLWFIYREMMEAGVDVVVLGDTIHAGLLSLGSPINLTQKDFSGDIVLRKDGLLYANQVLTEGAGALQGEYPEGRVSGYSVYPLVQDIVFDDEVRSEAALNAMARSRWDYSSGIVPRLIRAENTLTLVGNRVPINDLIPSRIVNVEALSMCFSERLQMKLGSVDVEYAAGKRTVAISLEPVGTLAKFDEISADDDQSGGS